MNSYREFGECEKVVLQSAGSNVNLLTTIQTYNTGGGNITLDRKYKYLHVVILTDGNFMFTPSHGLQGNATTTITLKAGQEIPACGTIQADTGSALILFFL